MNNTVAIKVTNLSKVFPLRNSRVDEDGVETNEHWALKDVSFEIKKGESVGIIGPNGSGKSTLLKILAGVTKPTSGKVEIRGKVASILDIGAGFHPELSGRENVYLNGQIHGFSKKEIESKFDEIVTFSGIKKFIDEPVKNYSNGMYLRLAFSIMAHLDFDVYLFDEVFSVGDAEFSLKTKKKFQELSQSNKTVVFVSHSISELEGLNSYILLEYGSLKEQGKDKELLSNYLENVLVSDSIIIHTKAVTITDFSDFPQSDDLNVLSVKFYQEEQEEFRTDKSFIFEIEYEKLKDTDTIDIMLNIFDVYGNIIISSAPFIREGFSANIKNGKYLYSCTTQAPIFSSGVYQVAVTFFKNTGERMNTGENNIISVGEIKADKTIEIASSLSKVLFFKPVYRSNNLLMDTGNLNMQMGLIPDFKWILLNETEL